MSTLNVEALYCDHYGWLHGWLRRRLGNAFEAADLAHDTFVRLLARSAPVTFGSPDEARGYLRTTAQNLCINLWHRQEIERAWIETLANTPASHYPSAERQAIVLEALNEISQMLQSLPEKAARAFVLTAACHMTDAEIAADLGVSDRTVRRYVAQAMLACLKLRARQTVDELRHDGQG